MITQTIKAGDFVKLVKFVSYSKETIINKEVVECVDLDTLQVAGILFYKKTGLMEKKHRFQAVDYSIAFWTDADEKEQLNGNKLDRMKVLAQELFNFTGDVTDESIDSLIELTKAICK